MNARTAIILALPVVLGIAALVVRPPRPKPGKPATRVVTAAPVAIPDVEAENPTESPSEIESGEEAAERCRATWRDLAVAEFDLRIQQLIASIDWTRAESRVRFPVEYERILGEFDRAIAPFRDPE